jgi:hypothetical protein
MKNKDGNLPIEVITIKLITLLISLITLIIMVIVLPKTVFDGKTSFRLATSMAVIDDRSLLFYDYQVYATESRFNQALVEDFEKVLDDFKSRSEIVALQIYGDNYRVDFLEDYVLIINPEVPELNIEYYVVRNLEFDGIIIPTRTFIILFEDIASLVNTIYITMFVITSLSIFTRLMIKSTKYFLEIKNTN